MLRGATQFHHLNDDLFKDNGFTDDHFILLYGSTCSDRTLSDPGTG